jgi:hypothetical protein
MKQIKIKKIKVKEKKLKKKIKINVDQTVEHQSIGQPMKIKT